MIAPQGETIGPAGLEPPAGARNRRKASVKKRRHPAPGFKALDLVKLSKDNRVPRGVINRPVTFCRLLLRGR